MIKAVIFDIDGVLIDSFEANLKLYQKLITKAGYPPPTKKEYLKYIHLTLIDCIKVFTKSSDKKEIKRIFEWRRTGKVDYPFELLSEPKDLRKTIEGLSKKYLLGIATHRLREGTYEIPQIKELKNCFKAIVCYQDTKNHKPHPEPLLLALKKLKIKPEESVYVGDVENDIKAGKAAGMKVIIYSRKQFASADICTSSFKKLPEIIESL